MGEARAGNVSLRSLPNAVGIIKVESMRENYSSIFTGIDAKESAGEENANPDMISNFL